MWFVYKQIKHGRACNVRKLQQQKGETIFNLGMRSECIQRQYYFLLLHYMHCAIQSKCVLQQNIGYLKIFYKIQQSFFLWLRLVLTSWTLMALTKHKLKIGIVKNQTKYIQPAHKSPSIQAFNDCSKKCISTFI